MDKIFTGTDKAHDLGFKTFREMTLELMRRQGYLWNGKTCASRVYARVDFGRWLADCECGGAAYADPDDPIFFCTHCGNTSTLGDFRTVVFPDERDMIEQELLARPVLAKPNMKPVDAAMNATSLVPGLARCWRPGETVEELRRQKAVALETRRPQ